MIFILQSMGLKAGEIIEFSYIGGLLRATSSFFGIML